MWGDCLDVMKEMEDNSIDVLITDPPYGIGEAAGKNKSRGQLAIPKDYGNHDWDNKIPDPEYFGQMIRVSKNQIIFGGNYFAHLLPPSSAWLVWDKDNSGDFADCELAWTSYRSNFDNLKDALIAFENDLEPVSMAWTSYNSAVRYFKYRWNGMLQGNMGKKEKRVHPTQKALPLMEWVISKYTKEGNTILDPFMGGGTTGVAALNFGRSFIGVEKDPDYFKIATKRIEAADAQITF